MRFGGSDNKSIRFLESFQNGLFISELVDNCDKRIHDFLRETNFENGSAIFGERSPEEMQDFRDVCNGALDNISDEDITGIIQFYVMRVKNYSHLENLEQARIKKARIVPSGKPRAGICKFYEAKLISVDDSLKIIKLFKSLSHDDYKHYMLQNGYKFPPLYPKCRCHLEGIIAGVDNSYVKSY